MTTTRPAHAFFVTRGWGIRAQTNVKSTAYRSRKQAIEQGLLAVVIRSDDGWYNVYTKEA